MLGNDLTIEIKYIYCYTGVRTVSNLLEYSVLFPVSDEILAMHISLTVKE